MMVESAGIVLIDNSVLRMTWQSGLTQGSCLRYIV